ncbi:MAG: MOSC domain-containing protein [Porphyrobacter sp.]|nr:MOSC domain-containing protein [Porphyrobacter sp.]
MDAKVIAVALDSRHRFSKPSCEVIRLLPGLGVAGDAHCGATVQHRSRLLATPDAPNLRQVHLIHAELFVEMAAAGFDLGPGMLGENVTTQGIDLLSLPTGTRLGLGQEVVLELTGLRNPCRQIDENIGPGAMAAVLGRDADGALIRKAGVMAIVIEGGDVRPGDTIAIHFLPDDSGPLEPV